MKKIASLLIMFFSVWACSAQKTDEPVLDSVSVDPQTNFVHLAWHVKSSIPDMGYIIFRQIFINDPKFVKPSNVTVIDDSEYYPIDTIYSTSLTNAYIDNKKAYYGEANPLYHPVSYKLRSFNAKTNSNGSATCPESSTVMLSTVVYDKCKNSNTLQWSAIPDRSKTLIYVKINDDVNFTFLAELPASDSVYVDKQVLQNTKYTYYVKCFKSGGPSTSSNSMEVKTPVSNLADFLILDYVSVENNTIKVSVSIDPSKTVGHYYILRSDSVNSSRMDTLTRFENTVNQYVFTDATARPERTYYYQVAVTNTCGVIYKRTDLSNNIVLSATSSISNPNNNHIDWNVYKTWTGGVKNYKLYRSADNGAAEYVATIGSLSHAYDDDVSLLKQETKSQVQKICYYVEAEEGNVSQLPVPGFAKSNVVCVLQESKIEMPNAFNPSSTLDKNRFFRPNFDAASDFLMIVYDRWGFKLFETKDPLVGWNGRSQDNNLVPEGVYVYYLTYSAGGRKIEQSGSVTVVSTNE